MIKYASAIPAGTACTEAILRRFTRNAFTPPTRRCSRSGAPTRPSCCCARYLRVRDLQREIEEGLKRVESSNGANSVIAYGKGGEINQQPPRRAGNVRALPADPANRLGLRQHP